MKLWKSEMYESMKNVKSLKKLKYEHEMKSMKVSKVWNHEKYETYESMKATTIRIQEKKTRSVEQMPAPSSEQAAIMIIMIIIYDL